MNYDPEKLTDISSKSKVSGKGRKPDSLLDKLCLACQDEQGRERARCSGVGCPESWKTPRQSRNILHHAMACRFLPAELREEARIGNHKLAPSAQLADLEKLLCDIDNESGPMDASVALKLAAHTAKRRELVGEDLLVRLICLEFLRPTLVDSQAFKKYVKHLDPEAKVLSSATYMKLIRAEAGVALQGSIDELKQVAHLSLSFDGATIRHSQSIYTVHVTSPTTRQAHLIEANEASGKSHTGTHIKEILLAVRTIYLNDIALI